MPELNNTLHDELKQAVREKIKTALDAELDDRLTKLKIQRHKLFPLHNACEDKEDSINFTSHKVDDLCDTQWPALASHIENVPTVLALHTLDLDVHWSKWSLTIHGIKCATREEDDVICKACLDLA